MNLIVDIGNTFIKVALFNEGEFVRDFTSERLHASTLKEFLGDVEPERAIICSTRRDMDEMAAIVDEVCSDILLFDWKSPLPIKNGYKTPETLGGDRVAAAVGATVLYPHRASLIVDFGTAVTIDYVDAEGVYRGGVISLGMGSRFRALHDYTARLPICSASDGQGLQGVTTREAIELGVMNSLTFEIEGYISRMRAKNEDLLIIFTGGDAKNFDKRIKNAIFATSNLVLVGLNKILEYNADK